MTSKEEKIAKAISEILVAIGEDPERTGLAETPKRVSKSLLELCASTNREFKNYKVFKENVDNNLIMVGNIDFYSLCEHHMLPFFGKVYIAYIANDNNIIGLSKLPRLVDYVSHKLTIQERITREIIDELNKILKPQGVAVLVKARHMCMEMRGVRKGNSITQTVKYSGIFKENKELQQDFLDRVDNARL